MGNLRFAPHQRLPPSGLDAQVIFLLTEEVLSPCLAAMHSEELQQCAARICTLGRLYGLQLLTRCRRLVCAGASPA